MKKRFETAEPERVFRYFCEISKIPRGSGNMQAISDYVRSECEKYCEEVRQDGLLNVIAVKEASPGYENAPAVMLQGHLDMVAEKTADSTHDFKKDPIELYTDGTWLFADRTTLGADDGTAVAYMLALLSDAEIKHPRLECVFTTDEETGMFGSVGISLEGLQAKALLNLDHDDEGTFTASCAGGGRFEGVFPVKRERASGLVGKITVQSEKGGHSGTEIKRDRPNANKVLGTLLYEMRLDGVKFRVVSIDGGKMDNAIPMLSEAVVLSDEPLDLSSYEKLFQEEFASTDDTVHLSYETIQDRSEAEVFDAETEDRILSVLYVVPNGAFAYHHKIEGLVDTSENVGILITKEDSFILRVSVRSSVSSRRLRLQRCLAELVKRYGGVSSTSGNYPGWPFRDSAFRDRAVELWNEMYPEKPAVVEAIHAGLECGLLLEKKPDLDIVALGPDAEFIHTPSERVSIPSVGRVYRYLTRFLEEMKD